MSPSVLFFTLMFYLSLRPPYLCSLLPRFIFRAHFYPEKTELITKIASEVLGEIEKLHILGTALHMVANPRSTSCLHLSLIPPLVFPLFHRFFPTPPYLPFFCQCLSVFVPLPLHSSKGEHSSQSRGDRGLVLERPLQQERALLKFPVALQPAEIQTAIKAKWVKQDCD